MMRTTKCLLIFAAVYIPLLFVCKSVSDSESRAFYDPGHGDAAGHDCEAPHDESPTVPAPSIRFDGSSVIVEHTVCGESATYFTTDGRDPRGGDGRPSPSARPYRQPVLLGGSRLIRMRTRAGADWSALLELRISQR